MPFMKTPRCPWTAYASASFIADHILTIAEFGNCRSYAQPVYPKSRLVRLPGGPEEVSPASVSFCRTLGRHDGSISGFKSCKGMVPSILSIQPCWR